MKLQRSQIGLMDGLHLHPLHTWLPLIKIRAWHWTRSGREHNRPELAMAAVLYLHPPDWAMENTTLLLGMAAWSPHKDFLTFGKYRQDVMAPKYLGKGRGVFCAWPISCWPREADGKKAAEANHKPCPQFGAKLAAMQILGTGSPSHQTFFGALP